MTKKGKPDQDKARNPDDIWKLFLERDAYLDKLQEDRANFWISVSGDAEKEKAALEKIEKVLNPEIDAVSIEVNRILHEYHEAKGDGITETIEDEEFLGDDSDDEEGNL